MARIKVRESGASAKKFAERGAAATPDYKAGVMNAGADWERNTAAAEENYAQGVQQAIGRGAFGRGVKAATGAYFQERAAKIGGDRYATGIREGAANWEEGTKPYLDALKAIELSPRGPKGDPRNMTRAQEVATALRRAKVGA